MKLRLLKGTGWTLTVAAVLALAAWPGEAAQRAVPRGSSGGESQGSSPAPQGRAPAPQGARAPSAPRDNGPDRGSGSTAAPTADPGAGKGSGAASTGAPRGGSGRRAVPYGRPNDGSVTSGTAVARTSPPPRPGDFRRPSAVYYPVGYYPWGYGGFGFGGYYGGGYYGNVYYGDLYDPWGYGYPRNYAIGYGDDGALKLKISPSRSSVFVDGYFAGQVDDFDGVFQRLSVEAGPHRIEIRADGFEPLFFDVRILPNRTVTYTGELKRY